MQIYVKVKHTVTNRINVIEVMNKRFPRFSFPLLLFTPRNGTLSMNGCRNWHIHAFTEIVYSSPLCLTAGVGRNQMKKQLKCKLRRKKSFSSLHQHLFTQCKHKLFTFFCCSFDVIQCKNPSVERVSTYGWRMFILRFYSRPNKGQQTKINNL